MLRETYTSSKDLNQEIAGKSLLRKVFARGRVERPDLVHQMRHPSADLSEALVCLGTEEEQCIEALLMMRDKGETGALSDLVTDEASGLMLFNRTDLCYLVKRCFHLVDPETNRERILSGLIGVFHGRKVLIPGFGDRIPEGHTFVTSAEPPGRYDVTFEPQADGSFLHTIRIALTGAPVRYIDFREPKTYPLVEVPDAE